MATRSINELIQVLPELPTLEDWVKGTTLKKWIGSDKRSDEVVANVDNKLQQYNAARKALLERTEDTQLGELHGHMSKALKSINELYSTFSSRKAQGHGRDKLPEWNKLRSVLERLQSELQALPNELQVLEKEAIQKNPLREERTTVKVSTQILTAAQLREIELKPDAFRRAPTERTLGLEDQQRGILHLPTGPLRQATSGDRIRTGSKHSDFEPLALGPAPRPQRKATAPPSLTANPSQPTDVRRGREKVPDFPVQAFGIRSQRVTAPSLSTNASSPHSPPSGVPDQYSPPSRRPVEVTRHSKRRL